MVTTDEFVDFSFGTFIEGLSVVFNITFESLKLWGCLYGSFNLFYSLLPLMNETKKIVIIAITP